MDKVRVGVIGLRMGAAHARAYHRLERARVVALCDRSEEALKALADEVKPEFTTTEGEELVARDDLDAVIVSVPDHFHAPYTIAALEAGKHVLCEKPMAPTWPECVDMVRASERTGRKLMVGQSYRFNAQFAVIRQAVQAGDLGEVFYVESQYWNNLEGGGGVGNWRNDPKIRHPFLGGCHALDLTRFIAGDIVEVSAYANHLAFKEQPTDDCITGQLVFESGAVGRALVASGCKCPFVTTLSVYGTEGSIEGGRICRARGATKQEWRWEELSLPQMPPPIEGEAAAFIEAIITDTPPPVEARDGLHTMAACFAVIDSAAQGGQPVRTPRMD